MIIKLSKVISCSSEHASYPASNLLQHRTNSSWRVAKPGEMLATVIFELNEPSCITGLDIGNYRSCVVIVTASTLSEPDNWVPVVNHQFMTHDEAANNKFRDQVQIFTKRELNPETIKIKFDRVKVTCMQSANLKELFGLSFLVLKTEVVVDLGLDVFGRFKLKQPEEENIKSPISDFKEKYLKLGDEKKTQDYKGELRTKMKETGFSNFSKRQEDDREPMKRPMLEKLEAGKAEEVFGTKNKESDNNSSSVNGSKIKDEKMANDKPVIRTPFGDIVPSPTVKKQPKDKENRAQNSRKRSFSPQEGSSNLNPSKKKQECAECRDAAENQICDNCGRLKEPKESPFKAERDAKKKTISKARKPKKLFSKLFEDVSFSLSGYVNPQRDEIRRKALQMGAKYIADPNTTNKKCTHLICAFKNTPKYQQLKGHCKIVSHAFIEECFVERIRFPWRRYALDGKDRAEPESEEEITGSSSPARALNPFEEETDSDSNY